MQDILTAYGLSSEHEIITEITPKGYNIESVKVELDEVSKYPDKTVITVSGFIDKFETKPLNNKISRISARLYKDGKSTTCFWITASQMLKKTLYGLQKQAENNQLLQVTGKVSSFVGNNNFRIVSLEQPKLSSLSYEGNTQSTEGFVIPEPLYRLKGDITIFNLRQTFRNIIKNIETIRAKDSLNFLP